MSKNRYFGIEISTEKYRFFVLKCILFLLVFYRNIALFQNGVF